MRIRDAITKPVVLVAAGALALTAAGTTIAVVSTSEPAPQSFGCVRREPAPPPVSVETRPLPKAHY